MDAPLFCCSSPDKCLVDDVTQGKALGRIDHLGDMAVDVETVTRTVEDRSGVDMRYVVLAMKGGSHVHLLVLHSAGSFWPLLPALLASSLTKSRVEVSRGRSLHSHRL